eukprot:Nitzschia sp. Nitz4//scaffold97_size77645//18109//25086//NITZ4_005513-RA/size77645-augustus-gene-0.24-mRNA-1//1//CDS//3329560641//9012//frame0
MKRSSSSSSSSEGASKRHASRRPARSSRFQGSMKDPPSESVRDLFVSVGTLERLPPPSADSGDESDFSNEPPRSNPRTQRAQRTSQQNQRKGRAHPARKKRDEESDDASDEGSVEEADDPMDQDDDLKIQRILACRTETKRKWREIGKTMTTSEVTEGSRWFQQEDDANLNLDQLEERFLVKWSDASYLHVSWETQHDLIDQVPGAKTYFTSFFRKATNGVLFSPDDRKDGDYFDPGYCQIGRILQVGPSQNGAKLPSNWDQEIATTKETFGIVTDTNHPDYEKGLGRQFLIKWESMSYADCSWEYERDLIFADIDYKETLEAFYQRTKKPTKSQLKQLGKDAEQARRVTYKLFGDRGSRQGKDRQEDVAEYQKRLSDHVYPNGGQLRDYQAEGVSWFLSNYVNNRSCIMADEMGLGKTLQTAAFINLLVTEMHRPGPFLIVVPLSTIAHWQREFQSWTGLNTIVYHGSADDRTVLREYEFAYQEDRPARTNQNSIYLKACAPGKTGGPWMATVVVTTPEMLVASDSNELAVVPWEVLVVDEAHRLKNLNSKLAMTLRNGTFTFNHKLLLTGTPIQNDITEFWTLLNFIDQESFPSLDTFLERFGEMKSKERVDEMHQVIRPYILRRLKEDVEKSVPPKEETLIEVELTTMQKQYYRALYEKNVSFLMKNKKKALDGPSLNNLAMQLRKCCNHLFLLNGVEQEIRTTEEYSTLDEEGLLGLGSGKLVLLDKLLPRLKENGHRVLLFSQFKIMLDVLEDYLHCKGLKFERIDGSITGHRRQAAIDRFQNKESQDPPFIMLLSTRAGGVGINLTSADTCIIFDSDWNPQNDLQAQARCHRIGQTKDVKVYRLLSRKTYEMQMFHMSSLKMGLDQAVLKGFESGGGTEGGMTKEEVEKLLRHGAYDIFNEEKAGSAEAESNAFKQLDIDSILERRATTVVHKGTGSASGASGGTFSKAVFVAPSSSGGEGNGEEIDVEDPDFWKKMVGEAKPEVASVLKPRKRHAANYSDKTYEKGFRKMVLESDDDGISSSGSSSNADSSEEDSDDAAVERMRWGGKGPLHWKKSQAAKVLEVLEQYGYAISFVDFKAKVASECSVLPDDELKRMRWAMVLLSFLEMAKQDVSMSSKRASRQEEDPNATENNLLEKAFQKLWSKHKEWASRVLLDARSYLANNDPRENPSEESDSKDPVTEAFYGNMWNSLKTRGWVEELDADSSMTYKFESHVFNSPNAVLNEVARIHPELKHVTLAVLQEIEDSRTKLGQKNEQTRMQHLSITSDNVTFESLKTLLWCYAPLQLVGNKRHKSIAVGRRCLTSCQNMETVSTLLSAKDGNLTQRLKTESKSALPDPSWTVEHDEVLVNAIAKHGWIDGKTSYQAIADDKSLEWPRPFGQSSVPTSSGDEESKILSDTAKRAAHFLGDCAELLSNFKGFNEDTIVEKYGLVSGDGENEKWIVDEAKLHGALDFSADQIQPLPGKKELSKRSKQILLKWKSKGSDASTPSSGPSLEKKFGFAVIETNNPNCFLLSEMVRGLAKSSFAKVADDMRLLCSLAIEEASALQQAFETSPSSKALGRPQHYGKIADQIKLALRSYGTTSVPAKNLIRAMVGMEPVQPKSPGDPMFPSEEFAKQQSQVSTTNRKESTRRDDGAMGDKAVLRSLKRAFDKSADGIPMFFATHDDPNMGLQLTMVEALVLLTFTSDGLPLSTSTLDDAKDDTTSWESALKVLEHVVRESHLGYKEKVQRVRATLKKFDGQADNDSNVDAAKRVASAEWEEALTAEALRQCSEMTSIPFAKKSIMLVEKIRRYAYSGSGGPPAKTAHKYENYLGAKVLGWFSKELKHLGTEFNIIDGSGRTMAFSTTDLLGVNSDVGQTRVAAFLDKKSAKQVISQIAMLTRLRSLVVKTPKETFPDLVSEAMVKSSRLGDSWEKCPSWWNHDTVDHSLLLLNRLHQHGFSNVLANVDGFGPTTEHNEKKSPKDLNLSKASLQIRANQLVRELHTLDEAHETLRLLEERRYRKQGMDSMAKCSGGEEKKSKVSPKGGGRQTGLRSFFTAFKPLSKGSKVTDVVDNTGSMQAISVLEKVGERKESHKAQENSNSSAKKLAPIFVVGGKRKEKESSAEEESPNKKLRTVVNEDGVIELVAVSD